MRIKGGPLPILFFEEEGRIFVSLNGEHQDYELIQKCARAFKNFAKNLRREDIVKYNEEVTEKNIEDQKKSYATQETTTKLKRFDSDGYIYVYRSDQFYKIGRSKSKDCRYTKYITENPNEIELICRYYVKNYMHVEGYLHFEFK